MLRARAYNNGSEVWDNFAIDFLMSSSVPSHRQVIIVFGREQAENRLTWDLFAYIFHYVFPISKISQKAVVFFPSYWPNLPTSVYKCKSTFIFGGRWRRTNTPEIFVAQNCKFCIFFFQCSGSGLWTTTMTTWEPRKVSRSWSWKNPLLEINICTMLTGTNLKYLQVERYCKYLVNVQFC